MSMVKFGGLAPFVAAMFTDTMDIYVDTMTTNEDGTTNPQLPSTPTYFDVPCRLSFNAPDNPDMVLDANFQVAKPTIYCAMDVDIASGYFVEVFRKGENGDVLMIYRGNTGMPEKYSTHIQIPLGVWEAS